MKDDSQWTVRYVKGHGTTSRWGTRIECKVIEEGMAS